MALDRAPSTPATPGRALEGSGIELRLLASYGDSLWDYWERNLDPDLFKDRSFEGAVNGKTVIITGASSGIGVAAAHKIAAAGGILLVARSEDKLHEAKAEIERNGGTAYAYTADLSDYDSIDALVEKIFRARLDRHARQQRGPLDPALGGVLLRPLPRLRADDQAQLPRDDQADPRRPPAHAREEGRPHRQRVVDRRADEPAALLCVCRFEGGARRLHPRGLERDDRRQRDLHDHPHAAGADADDRADKIYDSFPTISPDEAADLICEAIRAKPKQINTRLGTFGEVLYALAPKAVDQILHMAYKVFPESTKKKEGEENGPARTARAARRWRSPIS